MNAICSTLTIVGIYFLNRFYFQNIKLNKTNLVVSVIAISASLFVNIYSGGYKLRMEGLPDFTIMQSLKNTMHTFLMPLLHYKYLPFSIAALVIFIFFIKEGKTNLSKNSLVIFIYSLVIVLISFFLHCYTLSDIVPARGAIWGYCFLLFVFSFFFVPEKTKD